MRKRTVVNRIDEEGFSYMVRTELNLLKHNKNLNPKLVQQHLDIKIAEAITDLTTCKQNEFIPLTEDALRLKTRMIPGYKEVFTALLTIGQKDKKISSTETTK